MYRVPKMTAWEIYIRGFRVVSPHTLSEEVWGTWLYLQEYTRGRRQVGGSGSKRSYQDNVNYFANEGVHSETEPT